MRVDRERERERERKRERKREKGGEKSDQGDPASCTYVVHLRPAHREQHGPRHERHRSRGSAVVVPGPGDARGHQEVRRGLNSLCTALDRTQ